MSSVIMAMPYISSPPQQPQHQTTSIPDYQFSNTLDSPTSVRNNGQMRAWKKKANYWSSRLVKKLLLTNPRIALLILALILLTYFFVLPSFGPDLNRLKDEQESAGTSPTSNYKIPVPGANNNDGSNKNGGYVMVVDAGSSGTRFHLYRWQWPTITDESTLFLPEISEFKVSTGGQLPKKVEPGLSSFKTTSDSDLSASLLNYVTQAVDAFATSLPPDVSLATLPIYVYGTAGMRLVEQPKQSAIMKAVCDGLISKGFSKLAIGDCAASVKVISGSEEGLFGWVTANYLLHKLDSSKDKTVAFLDLGGASAQIAFEVDDGELAVAPADSLKHVVKFPFVTVDGRKFEKNVHSTTFLGFGANEARERFLDALIAESPTAGTISDPCSPKDLKFSVTRKNPDKEYSITGSGHFEECVKRMRPLLKKEEQCPTCLLNGVQGPIKVATIDTLYGVSEYWFSTEAFDMKEYDFKVFESKSKEFCNKPWSEAKLMYPNEKEERKQVQCFKAAWVLSVLHEGFELPKQPNSDIDGDGEIDGVLKVINDIDNVEVAWSLGVVIDHIMRNEKPPYVRGTRRPLASGELHSKETSASKQALIVIFILILGGVCFVLVRSSWFKENIMRGNAVEQWMSNRGRAQYMNVNAVSAGRGTDLEMGQYRANASTPTLQRPVIDTGRNSRHSTASSSADIRTFSGVSQPQQLEQQPVEQSEALSDKAELITAIQQLEQSRQRVKLILENDHTATSNFIQIANLLNEHKVKTESIRRDLITRTNKLSCILTEASQSMHEIKQKSSLALLQNI